METTRERYDRFITFVTDVVFILDREWRVLVVNDEACRFVEMPRETMVGARFTDVFDGVDKTELYAAMHAVQSERRPALVEERFVFSPARSGWFEVKLYPVPEGILCIARDITSRVSAERELEIAKRELHGMFDTVIDGVIKVDKDGKITYANRAAEHILGRSREELVGCSYHTVGRASIDVNGNPHDPELLPLSTALRNRCEVTEVEHGVKSPDGRTVWLSVNAAPLTDSDGEVSGAVASFRDITARKTAERALRISRNRLAAVERMEAVGKLAGGVAHEFNNLMTTILGYSELVFASDRLDPEDREWVEQINVAAQNAAELTQKLLAFARKQMMNRIPTDLNALLSTAESEIAEILGPDVNVRMDLGPDLWEVHVDGELMSDVFRQLALNSRDAMDGGGLFTIRTSNEIVDESVQEDYPVMQLGEYVLLSVGDTGSGMDPETQRRAFEPFFTGKQAGDAAGLGLAMVYGTVKQSGGYVWTDSRPGKGTTVRIYLPRHAAEGDLTDEGVPAGKGVSNADPVSSVQRVGNNNLAS